MEKGTVIAIAIFDYLVYFVIAYMISYMHHKRRMKKIDENFDRLQRELNSVAEKQDKLMESAKRLKRECEYNEMALTALGYKESIGQNPRNIG